MAYENLLVEPRGPVAWITLNRPQQRNPLNTPTIEELILALQEAQADEEVRVVVIQGAGPAFSAGADVREFRHTNLLQHRAEYDRRVALIRTLAKLGKPTIAVVHGYALGAGCGLVTWCDLAVAAEGTKFGYPEIKRGLSMGVAAVALMRQVGRKRAGELMMTGESVDAQQALQMGLVNQVVPQEKLQEAAMELAHKLARHSPLALRLCREVMWAAEDMDYWKALDYARDIHVMSRGTEDAQEGVAAYLEKREPQWKGR